MKMQLVRGLTLMNADPDNPRESAFIRVPFPHQLLLMIGVCGLLLVLAGAALAQAEPGRRVADGAPALINPGFECNLGTYTTTSPAGSVVRIFSGWSYTTPIGDPDVQSTRMFVHRKSHPENPCAGETEFVEKQEGRDSQVVFARDLEKQPLPGKPFDVVVFQRVSATVGVDYSVSGWFVSLCGGTANDCPDGFYIAKMLGVDATGGSNPLAPEVVWIENRRPHAEKDGTRIGWQNLYTSVIATTTGSISGTHVANAANSAIGAGTMPTLTSITIFARLNSPFQWHGNHGFIDGISVVRAPTVTLAPLPTTTLEISLPLIWSSSLGADIHAIPSGNYRALVDLQARHAPSGTWRSLLEGGAASGEVTFTPPCRAATYQFRTRVRAEQAEGEPGASPNHRYPSSWSKPVAVLFASQPVSPTLPAGEHVVYLPVVGGSEPGGSCDPARTQATAEETQRQVWPNPPQRRGNR